MRTGYFASLALLDDEVGRVLEALERKGIAQDTLVIFVSDHGDMLGDLWFVGKRCVLLRSMCESTPHPASTGGCPRWSPDKGSGAAT